MKSNDVNNKEKAQGMVEFALVLPILLLVILGIFAFGHLFFSYTMVVAASREAARFGAAAGITSGTEAYRDCAGIRTAAERVGGAAGVAAMEPVDWVDDQADPLHPYAGYDGDDPGVYIGYDNGPNSGINAWCHEVGSVAGQVKASDVVLGDRILVRVSIDYEPIVPLVDIPSFPLSATTARTIIKDVAISDVLPGSIDCKTTTPVVEFYLDPAGTIPVNVDEYGNNVAVVEQKIYPFVKMTVSDGQIPDGALYITAFGASSIKNCGTASSPLPVNNSSFLSGCEVKFNIPRNPYVFFTFFRSDDTDKQCHRETNNDRLKIDPAVTETAIVDLVVNEESALGNPSYVDETIDVVVQVKNISPGDGIPSGQVEVSSDLGECTITNLVGIGLVEGHPTAEGSCEMTDLEPGSYSIHADFIPENADDNPSYLESSAVSVLHTVIERPPAVTTGISIDVDPSSFTEGQQSVAATITVSPNNPVGTVDVWVTTDDGATKSVMDDCDDIAVSSRGVAYCPLVGEWLIDEAPYTIQAYFTSADTSKYKDSSNSVVLMVTAKEPIAYPPPAP